MIVWTDIETTGLSPTAPGAYPLEIASIITDDDLNVIASFDEVQRFVLPVEPGASGLTDMVLEMHQKNGLWAACTTDDAVVGTRRMDAMLTTWFDRWTDDTKIPLGGSTISFDRGWLAEFYPTFHGRLHYRNVDISSVKELVNRWAPYIAELRDAREESEKEHRAMSDIIASLDEARFYKRYIFGGRK